MVAYDDYDPWGMTLAGRSANFGQANLPNKFTGKEHDDDFGLNWDYFGARYYDAVVGRWLGVDPASLLLPPKRYAGIGLSGWSPFSYVRDSPLSRFDPDGFTDKELVKRGFIKLGTGLAIAGVGLFGLAESAGSFALVGGVVIIQGGFTTASFGIGDIFTGLSDSKDNLPDGPLVKTLTEAGLSRETALKVAVSEGFAELVTSVGLTTIGSIGEILNLLQAHNISKGVQKIVSEELQKKQNSMPDLKGDEKTQSNDNDQPLPDFFDEFDASRGTAPR